MSPVPIPEFITTANDCQISPLSLTSGFATNLNIGHVSDFLYMVFIFILLGSIISNEPQRWYGHSGDLYLYKSHLYGTVTYLSLSTWTILTKLGLYHMLYVLLSCFLSHILCSNLCICRFPCFVCLHLLKSTDSHEDQNRWPALHHSSLGLVYNLALIQCLVYGRYLTNMCWMNDWTNGAGLRVS